MPPPNKRLLICAQIGDSLGEPLFIVGKAKLISTQSNTFESKPEPKFDYLRLLQGVTEYDIKPKYWMELPEIPHWDYPDEEENLIVFN